MTHTPGERGCGRRIDNERGGTRCGERGVCCNCWQPPMPVASAQPSAVDRLLVRLRGHTELWLWRLYWLGVAIFIVGMVIWMVRHA